MFTGERLGEAIREAIRLKGITQVSLAKHFGVQPPSIQDWIKRGVIAKEKLPELWMFFSDVVGPEHWGLSSFPSLPDKNHNVEEGPDIQGLVPLISSDGLRTFASVLDYVFLAHNGRLQYAYRYRRAASLELKRSYYQSAAQALGQF